MTGSEIMAVVGFFVMLFGALSGIWWRIEGRVEKAKVEASTIAATANALASLTRQELAEHKLHTAETYVTKQGLSEQTQSLLRAIESLGTRIDSIGERIDNIIVSRSIRRP